MSFFRLFLFFFISITTALSADEKTIHGPDGDILVRGNGVEPETLDAQRCIGSYEANILADMFEPLLQFGKDGYPIPGVAETWTIDDTQTVYTFKLRQNARWSDGTPVTAHDFVFAWRRLVNPATASPWGSMLSTVKNGKALFEGQESNFETLGAHASDDHTLIVTLESPTPYFLDMLPHSSLAPLHRPTLEKHGTSWTQPQNIVSNGAFVMKEWSIQSHILLHKNPYYWDKEQVKIQGVRYLPIEDKNSELHRFRSGELHVTASVPPDALPRMIADQHPNLRGEEILSAQYHAINVTRPPLSHAKLRKALALAIDRQTLMEKVVKTGEKPLYNVVPRGVRGYTPPTLTCETSNHGLRDVETMSKEEREKEAKRLYQEFCEETGHPPQKALTLDFVYNADILHKKNIVAVAGMWKKLLGVKVTIRASEWKVYVAERQNRDYDVYRFGNTLDYDDPTAFLKLFRKSATYGENITGFQDDHYDALLLRAENTKDATERLQILKEAENILVQSCALIPLYQVSWYRLIDPRIKGWDNAPKMMHLSRWISIEKS